MVRYAEFSYLENQLLIPRSTRFRNSFSPVPMDPKVPNSQFPKRDFEDNSRTGPNEIFACLKALIQSTNNKKFQHILELSCLTWSL
jgi:hypothetical protein